MKMSLSSRGWLELAQNSILALFGFILPYYLYYQHPVGYVYFVTEDYWIEWATFVSLAMASGILTWMLVTRRDARTPGVILLALGAFFVAMEEISWGQRMLGLQPPDFFVKNNLQAEVNFHNLIYTPGYMPIGVAVLLWCVVLPLLARRSETLHRWCSRLGIPIVPVALWPLFILAGYFLLIYAYLPPRGEIAEGYSGIAIAALSLDLALTARRESQPRGVSAASAGVGMILIVWILTACLVRFYPAHRRVVESNLHLFAAFTFPEKGMYRQAEMLFDYINRNPQFLSQETHLLQGAVLMRMGNDAKAKEILELALADQEQNRKQHPDSPAPDRYAGLALKLLHRPQEAARAFHAAVEKDGARLGRAEDAPTKAWIHRSLGQTLYAMGDSEAAFNHFSMARALVPEGDAGHRRKFPEEERFRGMRDRLLRKLLGLQYKEPAPARPGDPLLRMD